MMLRNVRKVTVPEIALPAPLDAKPNAAADKNPVDVVMGALLVALIGFGVVAVYSASQVYATTQFHDPQFFLKRQAAYAVVALLIMFGISHIDYHRLYKLTYPVLAGVGLLSVLCVGGLGHSAGGAVRWIAIGPVHIQPAETAKLALVAWLAYSLSKKADKVKSFAVGFLPHVIVSGLYMMLTMMQSDFGSTVVLLLLTFTLLFVAGARVGYILGAFMLGAPLVAAAVRLKAYRWERILAWMDMEAHKQDLAYQPFQAVMSFGSGGPWGLGLGRGLQTLYLPEAHTDFVAAIIGEEFGFVGILCLCLAFMALVARGVRTALRSPDDYGSYLAFGISTMFGVQALVNLCVALSIVPTKGLTLPFISFGGSSLLVNAAAAGILLNISRHAQQKGDYEEDKAEPTDESTNGAAPDAEEDPAMGDVFADSQIADVGAGDAATT